MTELRVLSGGRGRPQRHRRVLVAAAAVSLVGWAVGLYALLKGIA